MKKERLMVSLVFDKKINLYGASFVNSKGDFVTDVEFAPTKTLALQWLYKNAPEEVIALTINTSDRYSSGSEA